MLTMLLAMLLASPSEKGPPPREVVAVTPEVAAKLTEIAFQAARDGDVKTLQAYFAAGRPVNGTNPRGDTLLTVAAYRGQPQAVELILKQKGVEVDARNKMGLTALAAAAFNGHSDIIWTLLAAKADPNAANASGQTALMFAALSGRTEAVKALLAGGAKPDATDKSGKSPLSLAKEQGATEVVKLLEAALQK